jgi:hypothetical protein
MYSRPNPPGQFQGNLNLIFLGHRGLVGGEHVLEQGGAERLNASRSRQPLSTDDPKNISPAATALKYNQRQLIAYQGPNTLGN